MSKTAYIAGRITGDPDYKKKFEDAAQKVEAMGYVVLIPSMLPAEGFEYEAYMRMTAAMLDECDEVFFLHDWYKSEGAMREFEQAKARGKTIHFWYE